MASETFTIQADQAGATLAAILRKRQPGKSWEQVRRFIDGRHVRVGGDLCLDPARRLKEGDTVEILGRSQPAPRHHEALVLRYVDEHLVVVEKPAGVCSVRHPSERDWPVRRKQLNPALEDLLPQLLARQKGGGKPGKAVRFRIVHRLDKETSGLIVLARSVLAERELGRQFRRHTVIRRYLAVVPGDMEPQRIASHLVRDRGDGRRGSTDIPGMGKQAVTHVEVVERLKGYTLVSCRLQTGRTHQIRIHLAELGHPVCGEKVYNRKFGEAPTPDRSGAPRLALHATELGLAHPVSEQPMHWTMPLPRDVQEFLQGLRGRHGS